MSGFFHMEAVEASSSEESVVNDSEAEISTAKKPKKVKKKKKVAKVLDSDDEEDEDEAMDANLEGFIDDNPDVEEEEGSGGESDEDSDGKRKHEESDLDEEVDEDDLDLVAENTGIRFQKKKKLKRIRLVSDEESDKEGKDEDDRDAIARQIFDDDDAVSEDERGREPVRKAEPVGRKEFGDLSESGDESEDNFIVDDEGQPITEKKKRHIIHDDVALQEAQEIFGVDFDFEDFDQYVDEYSEGDEDDEDEYIDDELDMDEPRPKKASKKGRKRTKKTTIYEIYEPSELERSHFTDQDQEIRLADMPERFQLRQVPICPIEEAEQKIEAEWIYKQAFCTNPVSRQDYWEQDADSAGGSTRVTKPPETVDKIKSALNFMRNQQFEVPFIAFYRKEYVEPELNINDLWKVYQWDEKWMQLSSRKANLVRLFEKMQKYQFDSIVDKDQPLESHVRALTEDDIERVKNVQTIEELRDIYQHFLLYYGTDIPKMKNFMKSKAKKEKESTGEGEEEEKKVEEEDEEADTLKQASRKTGYSICVQAGLADMANKFGLEAEKIAENMRDNYQRHDVEQDPAEPNELALEFINNQFKTSEDVLKGARHMVAMQIAHEPLIKQVVRTVFYERAMISTSCTKKGNKEIDETHPCYSIKYLRNKPISDLHNDNFMHIQQAAADGNMTYEIHMDERRSRSYAGDSEGAYFKEIKQLYMIDEFSHLVQEWNKQRNEALERALNLILYPQLIKEAKTKLLEEAKDHVLKACCRRLYGYLKVAPYAPDQQAFDDDEDFDTLNGVRVLGMAFGETLEDASFACAVDGEGEVSDHLRLPYITTSRNSWRPQDKALKERDCEKLKDFIESKKPHVIAIAAASRSTMFMLDEVKQIVSELEQEQQIPPIPVELLDNEMSVIYANSNKAKNDFREYPHLLCVALSIARRMQEPLVEFAQMCNPDEDILCLKYHPYQDVLHKEKLLSALYLEFVNRVNEVGVDVNKCVAHAHMAPLVQFVCGLGPRKGYHLLKILKQNNSRLENRTQLVTMCNMGPKVFINCAGFIKIDTSALGDSTEAYVEVLDGSRVHPETYEWARKMAIDALEYDETADDANPAGALEEILENPERLRELDLDAFAEELDRQGYGNKHITLYDIRAELNHRYKDLRVPYRTPEAEERFNMLTKETPQTFHPGKLTLCKVTGIAHRRPKGEQLDQANPVRNDETGLWQCPFCQKSDFPELSEVWNHFDAQECAGQAIGVKVRLDNGVQGFIHVNSLSDKQVSDPSERVRIGMMMHARIVKIDIERFSVNLTSKSSDLVDEESKWKPTKDPYYDYEADEKEKKKEEDKKKQKARQTYVKRVIVHPQFYNVDYKGCVRLMQDMDQGDVVIRPSSKGTDHLTCTWKVWGDILQHVDVREESKENAFSLGHSLLIENEEYEDLDEIIARFVQPIAQFARDITGYKYYRDSEGGKREPLEKLLYEEKRKAPSKIPYFLCASKDYPGKFLLSYLPRKSPRHEYVTVTPEGIRYRGQMFHSLSALVRWFKEHFRDPIPGSTPASSARTPAGGGSTVSQTPGHTPRGMMKGTPQIFNQMRHTPGMGYQMGRTPMMTPVMTPGGPAGMSASMGQTPGGAHFATPAANPHATPQIMATPQYQPTPRAQWPSATPISSGRTPQINASQSSGSSQRSSSAKDWAKMAEMWAKRNTDAGGATPSGRSGRRSPRVGSSPYGGGGGYTPGTPRRMGTPRRTPGTPRDPRDGGSTPLYDET